MDQVYQIVGLSKQAFFAWLFWLIFLAIVGYFSAQVPRIIERKYPPTGVIAQKEQQKQTNRLDSLECERQLKQLDFDKEETQGEWEGLTRKYNTEKIKITVYKKDPLDPQRDPALNPLSNGEIRARLQSLDKEYQPQFDALNLQLKRIAAERETLQKRLSILTPPHNPKTRENP